MDTKQGTRNQELTNTALKELVQRQEGQIKQLKDLRGEDRQFISTMDRDVTSLNKQNLFLLL